MSSLPGMAKYMAKYMIDDDINDVESISSYLNRAECKLCSFSPDGVLNHCDACLSLYEKARTSLYNIKARLELPKQTPAPMTYKERKEFENQRFYEVAFMRKSHQWIGSQSFADPGRSRMTPYASHCKACGLAMTMFKMNPQKCPKAV